MYIYQEVKEMEELVKIANSMKPDIERAGKENGLRIIEKMKKDVLRWKSYCEANNLEEEDYLYSKDIDHFQEGVKDMEEDLRKLKEIWRECKEELLVLDLKTAWEEAQSMKSRFKEEYEKQEPGSTERNQAYARLIDINRICNDINSVLDPKKVVDKGKLVREIFFTLKYCREYKNMINGVLF